MKPVKKILHVLYNIYALLLFVVLMLMVFPFVAVASLFGKIKGGNFIYDVCRIWADIWYLLIGVFHKNIFISHPDKTKPYIFVANHISYLDIPSILKAIRHQRVRALGKFETSKIPVFGFIYGSSAVMVDRSNAYHRARSVRILKSVLQKGISIFIFPEGTFNESGNALKDFYDGAFRIAIETNTPIRPILFLDTHDRLNYKSIFSLTPGKNRAVFLDEVSTENLSMHDVQRLKQKVFNQMETVLKGYHASWIAS
ncbi:MAG TPA: lysophospholipid acyltransferase family protein [Puia sp.]|nr:lysophospholipid acyltransferase family protein [Puia sp.]